MTGERSGIVKQASAVFSSQLAEFYLRERIAVGDHFHCGNEGSCRVAASGRGMKSGAEAHVGTEYGQLRRVVVVSLDAGGETKTLAEKQADVEQETKDSCNPHMRGTWRVVEALLGLGADVSPFPFCAITNSAKCTASDGKRDMAPPALFENCRSLARAELEILRPQVVVTQGGKAWNVLSEAVEAVDKSWLNSLVGSLPVADPPVQGWLRSLSDEYLRVWRCDSITAIVLKTPHPSARAGQWQRFDKVCLDPLAWLIRELLPQVASDAK